MSGREPGTGDASPATTTSVSVRGELVVRRHGTIVALRPKERAVLAAIALAHPQPVGVDRIVALVWGDDAPATARKTIQNHVARIRRTVDGLVETSALGYRFEPGVVIDRLSADRGDVPLADLPEAPEIDAHRQRINTHVVAAEEQRWESELAAGATPELIAELYAAAEAEPYRERRWHLLASAHAALGARREALQVCGAARRHLTEVGLAPGEELRSLEQRLVADEPAIHVPTLPIRPVVHPHRHEPFVGRTSELARLADAWRRVAADRSPRLVVVQGPAGSGKTRLVDEFCRSVSDETVVLVVRHRPDGGQALAPIADAIRPVIDLPLPPTSSRSGAPAEELVDAVRATLRHLGDRPHVVVLDDAHWATSDANDVVAAAIDGIATPTLVLLTTRPHDVGEPPWPPIAAVAACTT